MGLQGGRRRLALRPVPTCLTLRPPPQPPPPPHHPTPTPQVRKRKWDSYSSGEELFGLPVTQYPELERTEAEVTMLDKLYRWGGWLGSRGAGCWVLGQGGLLASRPLAGHGWRLGRSACAGQPACSVHAHHTCCQPPLATLPCLPPHPAPPPPRSLYVSVITTIRGYGDYLWVDVVERVDAMATQARGWRGAGAVQAPCQEHHKGRACLPGRPQRVSPQRSPPSTHSTHPAPMPYPTPTPTLCAGQRVPGAVQAPAAGAARLGGLQGLPAHH